MHQISAKLNSIRTPKSQRGAVLFVALIMLLLLTLIGLAGMQSTLLQERMSGNFYTQQKAFELAETALQNTRNTLAADAPTSGPTMNKPVSPLVGQETSWQAWITAKVSSGTQPQVNQWYSSSSTNNKSMAMGTSTPPLSYYVVTAPGTVGASGRDFTSVVQGIFIF